MFRVSLEIPTTVMLLIKEVKKRRGIDVVEGEGQASSTDNIYQPAAANVTEGAVR